MSLANAETYIREHLWVPLRRSVVSWSNQNLLQSYCHSIVRFVENIRNDPPIYRQQRGDDGKHTEILVRLPCIGPVTLDVFAFASSALVVRVYMFWRGRVEHRRKTNNGNNHHSLRSNEALSKSSPVKAKRVVGFRDDSLQKTIQECQDVKQRLRKIQDPELARKQRQRDLKCNTKDGGYLGMSRGSLQKARKDLKQVTGSNQRGSQRLDQTTRLPVATREVKL
jgi:hypothetical protein